MLDHFLLTSRSFKIMLCCMIIIYRATRAGGVAVYVKSDIEYSTIFIESKEFIEQIWLKTKISNKVLIIGTVYRPPNTNSQEFFSYLEDTLVDLYTSFDSILLMGDFNINMYNLNNNLTKSLLSIAETFNMDQLITEPTRITATGR